MRPTRKCRFFAPRTPEDKCGTREEEAGAPNYMGKNGINSIDIIAVDPVGDRIQNSCTGRKQMRPRILEYGSKVEKMRGIEIQGRMR